MFRHELRSLAGSRLLLVCALVVAVGSFLGGLVFTGVGLAMVDAGQSVGPADLVEAAVVKGSVAPAVAGVMGALTVGRLFRAGGLSTWLWLVPRRRRLAALLLVAPAAGGAALGLLGALAVAGAAVLVGSGAGVGPDGTLLRLAATQVLVGAGSGVVGAGVALVLRSQTAALALMLAGPLVLEPLARALLTVATPGERAERLAQLLPVALLERVQVGEGNPVVPVAGVAPPLLVAALVLTLGVAAVTAAADRRLAAVDA